MAVAMAGSLVAGANVAPTPAAPLKARQALGTDPAQLSSLLENPSSALALVSSLITVPYVSSAFREVATNSAYLSQASEQLISQYGTESGQQALQSYEAVVNSLLGETVLSATPTGSADEGSSGGSSEDSSGGGSSSAGSSGSSSSGGSNAAAGLLTIGAVGTAVVAGAAFVIAAL